MSNKLTPAVLQKELTIASLTFLAVMLCPYFQAISQPGKALPAEKIITFIPDKIESFNQASEFKSKLIRLGDIQYSVAEKNFSGKKKRTIKILLFDYKEAPVMYNQAARSWSTFQAVENDSLVIRPAFIKDCTGWETYHVRKKNAQILLGICNRFFLTIEGTGVELEILKEVVQKIKFEEFPK